MSQHRLVLPVLLACLLSPPVWAELCVSHDECPPETKCDFDSHECIALQENDCRADEGCPDTANQYCDLRTATCRYYCSMDGHCIQDAEAGIVEYCDLDTNHCEPIPDETDGDGEDAFCQNDWDCDVEDYCDFATHRCVPRCTGDFDCPEGEVCMAGRCKDPESDDTWDYPDGDTDGETLPDGDDTPSPDGDIPSDPGDGDEDDETEPKDGDNTGGLSGCPAGEICLDEGEEDNGGSDGCRHPSNRLPGAFGAILLLALALAFGRRRAC